MNFMDYQAGEPADRPPLVGENLHLPAYTQSLDVAPEKTLSSSDGNGNAFEGNTPPTASPFSFVSTQSPPFSGSSPLTIDTTTETLKTDREFSFSHTPTGEFKDAYAAKESIPTEQPPLEIASHGNFDKIVYHPDDHEICPKKMAYSPLIQEISRNDDAETTHVSRKRKCWLIGLALAIVIIIGVALGAGLGLGLRPRPSSQKKNGNLSPSYLSTKGAFNGSGIALTQQSFDDNSEETLVLYYQHYTGSIRFMQLRNGNWIGGTSSEIVAYDAKNGTPVSAVAYTLNETSTWHIFYINNQNQVCQKSNSNQTNIWQDGPLNKLNLTAMDSEAVGMQACWYGNFYGDSDYETFAPLAMPNIENTTNDNMDVGMHIWYASNETTFEQYGWRGGEGDWEPQGNWTDKNGHAGVGCYSWGPGTVTYTMMVNTDNILEIWWKDTNTSLLPSKEHPINAWTNSSVAIKNVYPSTSLGYTAFLYAQDAATLELNGYKITWDAEKTNITASENLVVEVNTASNGRPLAGSHFSVAAVDDASGGESLLVFYQTDGNDITEFKRDILGGEWTYSVVPVDES